MANKQEGIVYKTNRIPEKLDAKVKKLLRKKNAGASYKDRLSENRLVVALLGQWVESNT